MQQKAKSVYKNDSLQPCQHKCVASVPRRNIFHRGPTLRSGAQERPERCRCETFSGLVASASKMPRHSGSMEPSLPPSFLIWPRRSRALHLPGRGKAAGIDLRFHSTTGACFGDGKDVCGKNAFTVPLGRHKKSSIFIILGKNKAKCLFPVWTLRDSENRENNPDGRRF